MKPSDITHLPIVGRPSLSADGGFVAFVVSVGDAVAGTNEMQLWGGPTSASSVRCLTDGTAESAPAVSPDATMVAFLRPDDAGRPQVSVLTVATGEVRVLGSSELGSDGPVWSPDSTSLAFSAYCVVDPVRAQRATVHITSVNFYAPPVGYTAGYAKCLHVLDVEDGSVRQLTFDSSDDLGPDWSPDGERISFISAKQPSRIVDPQVDVWSVAVADGKVSRHTHGGLSALSARFGPDGGTIYFCGTETRASGFNDGYASIGVWVTDTTSEDGPWRLTHPDLSLSYVCQTIVPHGDYVYFGADVRGSVPLLRFDRSTPLGTGEVWLDGEFQVNGFAIGGPADRPIAACVVASLGSAGDVVVFDGDESKVMTPFGAELRRQVWLVTPERIDVKVPGRDHRLDGWVLTPDGPGPHPVVLLVKGGPYTQFGWTLSGPASFEDAQVLCEAGFLVVLGNPRGSSGYGQDHVRGVMDALPEMTTEDLLALLDHALVHYDGRADRVGVMGGSFGGYMAAWLAATTDRFAGAIAERGCYELESYAATSDGGVNVVHALWGDDQASWRRYSPLSHIDDVQVPVMFLHSDQDRHAPIAQARQMFVELRLRGKESTLTVFPNGTHELSRSGPIHQRIARFEAILDWWRTVLVDG
jgi:dipeptidyl aminopeptidase/acylaminoacyl peptidase